MDNTKVLEYLNQSVMTNYLEKLTSVKMKKVSLCPVFPITAAPNLSEPVHFAMIENPQCLIAFTKGDLN
jgi:hypothetical protein